VSAATVEQYREWLEQTADQYAETQTEIERLGHQVQGLEMRQRQRAVKIHEQQAENERLRGYLEYLRIHVDSGYTYENIEAGMKSLDDELKEIVDFSEGGVTNDE